MKMQHQTLQFSQFSTRDFYFMKFNQPSTIQDVEFDFKNKSAVWLAVAQPNLREKKIATKVSK